MMIGRKSNIISGGNVGNGLDEKRMKEYDLCSIHT